MLAELFEAFLRVGVGAYGGGAAVIRLIYHEIVEVQGWLSAREMTEVVALAEMTPGPIAVNAATYTGFCVGKLPGAILATTAVLLPALFFLFLLLGLRRFSPTKKFVVEMGKLLQPGVVALIAAAVWSLGQTTVTGWLPGLFAAASFLLLFWKKIHPALVLILFGLLGIFLL